MVDAAGSHLTRLTAPELCDKFNAGTFKMRPTAGAIYRHWHEQYDAAKARGLIDKDARGAANEATATRFKCDEKTVQNARTTVRAMQKMLEEEARDLAPELKEFERINRSAIAAKALMRVPQYKDLVGPCTLNLGAFGHRGATDPDSLQRLASVFAQAFLQAHEGRMKAERRAETLQKWIDGHKLLCPLSDPRKR